MIGWRLWIVAVALVSSAIVACGDQDDPDETADSRPVPECADLRARENQLIDVMNDTLSAVGDSRDETERASLLIEGMDRVLEVLESQVDGIESSDAELADALRDGAESAVAEFEIERDEFAASVPVVSDDDERGRVGQVQNALEKAFSHLEPPRSVYESAGLGAAIDADPNCEFVTQRKDPAGE